MTHAEEVAGAQIGSPMRPIVYWSLQTVALHYMRQGERVKKSNMMLALPRTPANEKLLVAMANGGRALLNLPLIGA